MEKKESKDEFLKAAMIAFCEAYDPAIDIQDADEMKLTVDVMAIFEELGFNVDVRTTNALMVANFFKKLNLETGMVWLLKRK